MGDSNIVQASHSEIIDAIDSPEEDEICLDRSQLMENVKLIQPWANKVAYVRLNMWRMTRACCTYNLIETWRKGVVCDAENALRDGTMLQLCVFRRY